MMRFLSLWWLLLFFTALAEAAPRPNIVFILVDDLRWDAPGFMGNAAAKTPHLDTLAKRSAVFRQQFVTTSICAVSRASILSGQWQRRSGMDDFGKTFSPEAWKLTYPALLRAAGYSTGFIGKFGVGGAKAIAAMSGEFDYWKGLPGQGSSLFINPKDPEKKHETARMGDEALEFLSAQGPEKPFCLSVSFTAVHARDGKPREFQPDLRDESLFADSAMPVPPLATDAAFQLLPDFVKTSEGRTRWKPRFSSPELAQSTIKDYFRLLYGVDREVGRILETLKQRNLTENTLIIFTSDNGFFLGDRGLADKWFMYEESIRVPLFIFDPRIPEKDRPRQADAITLNVDVAPTIVEAAGIRPPATMQGRSLLPLLTAAAPADWRKEFFYEHHCVATVIPPSEGVRTGQWKYIKWIKSDPLVEELFDLQSDPGEQKNLATDPSHASTLSELREKWKAYSESLK